MSGRCIMMASKFKAMHAYSEKKQNLNTIIKGHFVHGVVLWPLIKESESETSVFPTEGFVGIFFVYNLMPIF